MALSEVSIEDRIVGLLRQHIPDYQARSSNWIYADRPLVEKLIGNKANFPRISVEPMASNSIQQIGVNTTELEEAVSLLINVWCVKDDPLDVLNTVAESHTFDDTEDIYALINIPASKITAVTGTVSGNAYTFASTDYTILDNDSDGMYESIQWLGLNDPDDATAFLVTYARVAEGIELAKYVGLQVHQYLRDNWQDDLVPYIHNYKKIAGRPVTFEQSIGVYRYELQIGFTGINIGD